MNGLVGYKQSPEHIQKRKEAVAKTKEAWSEERRNLFKLRVSLNNRSGDPEIRVINSTFHKGRIPWNKGKIGCMPIPWNKGTKKHTPDEERTMETARARKRREQSPQLRVHERISALIRLALKGRKNGHTWESLVGYSTEQLMAHLESKFKDGMSWDNMGEWHIDHIIPRIKFKFNKPSDTGFKKCWALSNLQPL